MADKGDCSNIMTAETAETAWAAETAVAARSSYAPALYEQPGPQGPLPGPQTTLFWPGLNSTNKIFIRCKSLMNRNNSFHRYSQFSNLYFYAFHPWYRWLTLISKRLFRGATDVGAACIKGPPLQLGSSLQLCNPVGSHHQYAVNPGKKQNNKIFKNQIVS